MKTNELKGLRHRVAVYVPETTDVNTQDTNEQTNQVRRIAAIFSGVFGGCSAQRIRGYWNSDIYGLVEESPVIVYANTDKPRAAALAVAVREAERIKNEMNQEAVSVEFDGELFFI